MTSQTSLNILDPFAGQRQSTIGATAFLTLATIALLPHFILSALFGGLGLAIIAVLTVGACFLSAEFAFALLMICLFLQNLFIAIVTPLVQGLDQFTPMLGTSFINTALTSFAAAIIWLRARNDLAPENKAVLQSLIFFYAVIVIYSVLGALHASFTDALVYMRVYVVGGMMLMIGLAFGLRLSPGYVTHVMRAMSFILVLWGFMEFFFTYEVYSVFNIADYIRLKYASAESMSVHNVQEAINFVSRNYLNLSGSLGIDLKLVRPEGPNIHPISYAYALAFGGLVCYVYRFQLLMMGCLALLVLVGAKGPLTMTFLAISLSMFYWASRNPKWLLVALGAIMAVSIIGGIAYGLYTEDYHVVGFLGGVKGFFANPLGYGVGVGGNLSSMALEYTNFNLFQGYGASFALESGFGVMLYQIGLCTGVFLLFYWRLWRAVWRASLYFAHEPRFVAIPCALGLLLVNSVFQEEAFSPAGWGPLMLLSGLLLAKYWSARAEAQGPA